MLVFHLLKFDGEIHRTNPLYVGNFFNLSHMWWSKRKLRQNLILTVAATWYRLIKNNKTMPGFIEEEVLVTSLTSKIKDAKVILEYFFDIVRLGYNFNNGTKSPTIVRPKRLPRKVINAISILVDDLEYDPGLEPCNENIISSSVRIQSKRLDFIRNELSATGKLHLFPAVKWLSQFDHINFYFEPAGKLKARDKSIWPVKSIETWPGWLRQELFGTVIDLENAYLQFLITSLYEKYKNEPTLMELKYPDLVKAHTNKNNFRKYICEEILQLPLNGDNLKIVKKVLMSIANGSNISPLMLINSSGRSEAVNLVLNANPNLTQVQMLHCGKVLGFICRQFKAAKKDLYMHLYKAKPTRENQKSIFKSYMKWERDARYKMWEAAGFTGINAHDGLDGIIIDGRTSFSEEISKLHGLSVKVENYVNC